MMGFKCPKCHEEFSTNQQALFDHLKKNVECKVLALSLLSEIGKHNKNSIPTEEKCPKCDGELFCETLVLTPIGKVTVPPTCTVCGWHANTN